AEAWEPFDDGDGAAGEYRSTRTYADVGGAPEQTALLGNFVDSMTPLHGYRLAGDMRSDNPYWNVSNKVGGEEFVYCGPGIWYDHATGRIHARLAHTRLPGLGDDNYRGELDPRRLPLVIAALADGPAVSLDDCRHVRLQDLVVRGARSATLAIANSQHVELDGVTAYGGSAAMQIRDTRHLRMVNSACRGLAAPWTFRGSLKYRAIESRLFSASGWEPTGADASDFEIQHCEFTDSVDGVFIGNVARVRFHHNLLDNVSDDGIFLTAATSHDGQTVGGDVRIYQNRLARCLTTFAFGVGHGRQRTTPAGKQLGAGVWIYRNVFDFRQPVMYYWPTGPDAPQEIRSFGRVAGDHGGPGWEPMWIYHNTILANNPPRYAYGTNGLNHGLGHGTTRRVFNNIICQMDGMPGDSVADPAVDFQADGNLFWSLSDGPSYNGEWLGKFRRSPEFVVSQQRYSPGWTAHDRFADPAFVSLKADWRMPADLRLRADSPAIDAGVPLPDDWPDVSIGDDTGRPDIGAVPSGGRAWPVGMLGRLSVFGEPTAAGDRPTEFPYAVRWPAGESNSRSAKDEPAESPLKALIVQGYPAFDAPLVEFVLRRRGARPQVVERTWVDPREFAKFDVVVIDGNFTRAKIQPDRFSPDDIEAIRQFLTNGGTLLLMRERTDLFASDHGRELLAEVFGEPARESVAEFRMLAPEHPWLRGLDQIEPAANTGFAIEQLKAPTPIRANRGERVIGTVGGTTLLASASLGKGRMIYVGWSIAASRPEGRRPSTVEDEAAFLRQMKLVANVVAGLRPASRSTALER
ncbi:MAG: right-handed parallel beta-helix repeat-containing protein, partial [Planctomycetales bacterium]|nr:right-handed parallel beta-helix repeat-containing protein [Planctomycetales bacterium]